VELIHTNQSYTDGTYTIKCSKNLFPDKFIKKNHRKCTIYEIYVTSRWYWWSHLI